MWRAAGKRGHSDSASLPGAVAPACPVPREPTWHLVLEAAFVKREAIELLQLVAQIGLPPVAGLWDPGLVAKLLSEYICF